MPSSPQNPYEDPVSRRQQTRASYPTAYPSSQHPSEARMSSSTRNPYEDPFSRRQQTRASYPTAYPSSQHPSEARYHSGQMYSDSYNKVPPPYTSVDHRQSPPSGVPMGRPLQGPPHCLPLDGPRDGPLQGPPPYPYHHNIHEPPTSSHPRSSHSRQLGFPQDQSRESWREDDDDESGEDEHQAAHPAWHSPVPAAAAANMHNERLKEKSHPSLDYTGSSPQGPNFPYARVPTPPPVFNDVPRETAEPKTKNSRCTDVRPLEAPNKTDDRPASLTTEQYRRIGAGLDIYPGRFKMNLWFQNDTKQSTRRD